MADVAENLNALHKTTFNEGVPELVPQIAKIQREFKFESEKKVGDFYEMPVRLALPSGFTHEIADGSAGVYTLNDSQGGTSSKAKVYAYQTTLRDQLSYEDAAKCTGGEASYKKGSAFFFEGMNRAAKKRVETDLLYGQVGIGVLQTYTSGDPSVVIKLAEWAPQIWSGMKGATIDIMNGTTSTVRGSVQIVAINVETRKITLSATVSGATANDVVYFKGGYGKTLIGIHKILANTGSLMNLDAAVYDNWMSVQHAITGALSLKAIKKAIAKCVGKGLMDDIVLFVNHLGWDDIQEDVMNLRSTDKSEIKKIEIGTEEIEYVSQNGRTRIVSHPMVKEGYAYGLCKPYWHRIGTADFALGVPGMEGGDVWFHLPTKTGFEARGYTSQAIYTETPANSFMISGIVNTTT